MTARTAVSVPHRRAPTLPDETATEARPVSLPCEPGSDGDAGTLEGVAAAEDERGLARVAADESGPPGQ